MNNFNLHKVKMNVVETATNGMVNERTIFYFKQKNNIVSAKYAGGKVEAGFLAGTIDKNILRFKYAQKPTIGKIVGGVSVCQITFNKEGKIELAEFFEWDSGRGNNIFQELNHYYTIAELKDTIKQFEDFSLPKEQWNHLAHLVVCAWYRLHFNLNTAFAKMRKTIISYNEATGTINSDTSGSHETITRFWFFVIDKFIDIENIHSNSTERLINSFLNSEYAKRDYIFNFYSKKELFTKQARLSYIPSKKSI